MIKSEKLQGNSINKCVNTVNRSNTKEQNSSNNALCIFDIDQISIALLGSEKKNIKSIHENRDH